MTTRRDFVKLAGTGALATTLSITNGFAVSSSKTQRSFNMAVAGYTFLAYKDNLDKIIEVMNAVGTKFISLKNFQYRPP